MKLIGNFIWFVFGGFLASLLWLLLGFLLSITIIGLPFGMQCFKFSKLVLFPFGQDVLSDFSKHPIINIIWAILVGWEMALGYLSIALIYAISLIGIPFAIQWIKLAVLALFPFGAKIR
ncbi:MAG: YccF domain-containing protein [Acholeplasmataceae bacterium]|nr:YccF domain-containing protein [Acholeplasmataceae bacterium]